ncbi:MAG: hypothetical protein HGA54_01680 [Actinobacteria bacterium]|nr:hypothetical protein [Actinomycetota bacterium]
MRLYLSPYGQDLSLDITTNETTGTLRVNNAEGKVGEDITVTIVPSDDGPSTATAHVDLTVLDDYD